MKCSLSPQVVQSLMQYHEYTQSSAEFQWFVVVYQVSSVFLSLLPRNVWNESACHQWALPLELLFNISCNFLIQTHFLKHLMRKSLYSPHTNILAVEGLWLIISQNCRSQHFLQTYRMSCPVNKYVQSLFEKNYYCMSLTYIWYQKSQVQIGDDSTANSFCLQLAAFFFVKLNNEVRYVLGLRVLIKHH